MIVVYANSWLQGCIFLFVTMHFNTNLQNYYMNTVGHTSKLFDMPSHEIFLIFYLFVQDQVQGVPASQQPY
jgi:hypothetical protein